MGESSETVANELLVVAPVSPAFSEGFAGQQAMQKKKKKKKNVVQATDLESNVATDGVEKASTSGACDTEAPHHQIPSLKVDNIDIKGGRQVPSLDIETGDVDNGLFVRQLGSPLRTPRLATPRRATPGGAFPGPGPLRLTTLCLASPRFASPRSASAGVARTSPRRGMPRRLRARRATAALCPTCEPCAVLEAIVGIVAGVTLSLLSTI